jgi:hypothetical protein
VDIPKLLKMPAALMSSDTRDHYTKLIQASHAGTVLLFAARIERELARLIEFQMTPLSEASRKKLFDGDKAPLGTFFAKIEIARGLHLIDTHEYRTLSAIRDIRNKFAHHDDELHADSQDDDLARRFTKLPKLGTKRRMEAFIDAIIEMSQAIEKRRELVLQAFIARAEMPDDERASHERSSQRSRRKSAPDQR